MFRIGIASILIRKKNLIPLYSILLSSKLFFVFFSNNEQTSSSETTWNIHFLKASIIAFIISISDPISSCNDLDHWSFVLALCVCALTLYVCINTAGWYQFIRRQHHWYQARCGGGCGGGAGGGIHGTRAMLDRWWEASSHCTDYLHSWPLRHPWAERKW